MKTGPHGRKYRTFLEEEGFDFRECAARRLVSAELRRFLLILSLFILLMCVVGPVFPLKSQQNARNMRKPLVNHVRSVILEHLRKKKLFFFGGP